jgi:hypothetical protein
LVLLPGYSPDLNPIECLWKWMREEVTQNHCYNTMRELFDACKSFIGRINLDPLPEKEMQKRTLTKPLQNARSDWRAAAHRRLDAAVFAAYGWPDDISDEKLPARLLALNLARAEGQ